MTQCLVLGASDHQDSDKWKNLVLRNKKNQKTKLPMQCLYSDLGLHEIKKRKAIRKLLLF